MIFHGAFRSFKNKAIQVLLLILSITCLVCAPRHAMVEPGARISTSLPSELIGTWQVTEVHVDTEATRTLQYQFNDPRLKGRLLTIALDQLKSSLPEKETSCVNPTVTAEHTTAAELIKKTMPGRGVSPNTPTPKDYELQLAPNAPIEALYLHCKGGGWGPPVHDSDRDSTWTIVLPNGQLAIRWFDFCILIFSRLPANARPSPSFDCAKAASPVEKTICESINLAAFDRSVAESYTQAVKLFKEGQDTESLRRLQATQKEWLAKRNHCGADTVCLEKSMEDRLEALVQFSK
jgi:uncharacterized protein YecT (DUF1311 family)